MPRGMVFLVPAVAFFSVGCSRPGEKENGVVLPIQPLQGKVVCVGDSLTAAEGVRPEEGFPAKLDARSERIAVVQQGRSGWPTTAYLRRIDEVLAALPADADVILLQLGANDLRMDGHSDETVARTADNLGELIDRLRGRAQRAKLVVLAPPTMVPEELTPRLREAGFGAHSPPMLHKLSAAYRDLAARKSCGFIDLFPLLAPGDTLDGAHPNDAGHTKIADEIWRRLAGDGPSGTRRTR